MSLISTSQDITIDFNFNPDILAIELFSNDAFEIEEQIMDAIELCNADDNVDIANMTIVEGGVDVSINPTTNKINIEDGVHLIVTCDIDFDARYLDETDGISLNMTKFIQYLKNLDYIGDYIDTSSVDVSIYDYSDDFEYTTDEPDWDSMPGGHDYYDD